MNIDKIFQVTNIFSSHSEPTIMGNQANKEKEKEKDINGINIPKVGSAQYPNQRARVRICNSYRVCNEMLSGIVEGLLEL